MKTEVLISLIRDKGALMDTLAKARMSIVRKGEPLTPLISLG